MTVALFVAGLLGLLFRLARPPYPSAPACWGWAWGVLLLSVLMRSQGLAVLGVPATAAVGPIFSGLLVAGALLYAGSALPLSRVLALAVALAGARCALYVAGFEGSSGAIGVAAEPALDAAAALLVVRAERVTWAQRMLPVALLGIAGVDALSAVLELRGVGLTEPVFLSWATIGATTLGLQATATSQRAARERESLLQEVAARRALELELRAAEERYRTVSELSSDYSFAHPINPDGSFERGWMTEAAHRLTGYDFDELEEIGLRGLLHPEDAALAEKQIQHVMTGEPASYHARIVRKDGEVRLLFVRMARVRTESDGRDRLVGVTTDITPIWQAHQERHRLEAHLGEVQRLDSLGTLAGGIAHDFNNALSVILGNCSVALAELPGDSPMHTRLGRIRTSAQHAAALTQQMLAYAGRSPLKLTSQDLSALVEDSWPLLEAAAGHHPRLAADLTRSLPPVEADATQLRQVLVNLVANASEAMAERPGQIRVRTGLMEPRPGELAEAFGAEPSPAGPCAFLEVCDEGPGMDDETRRRIFEPFFSTKFSGRGLGLAAVLGIVRGHGGVITLETRPEAGARFRVLLPTEASGPRLVDPDPGAGQARAHGRQARVLVIDDDEAVREVAALFLSRAGFHTLTAASGPAGIQLLRERGPAIDAVLLDLIMPGLDGEATLMEIRKLRPSLPVVVASGHERGDPPGNGLRGVAGFLRKPYEPEALIESLEAALA